jgi:long-chain acyl-CoA synthetase
VGVPNPDRPGSEIVKAVIQKASGAGDPEGLKEEIIAFCKENMAPYKIPKIVEFVDEIPLTAVGKVDKKALR